MQGFHYVKRENQVTNLKKNNRGFYNINRQSRFLRSESDLLPSGIHKLAEKLSFKQPAGSTGFIYPIMKTPECIDRRTFLKSSAGLGSLIMYPGTALFPFAGEEDLNIIGPRKGYSPYTGILVSMLEWMRATVISSVKGLSEKDLDYLHDKKSNTIGALLLHLAATEAYYGTHTFGDRKWGDWSREDKEKWDVAMTLGEPAREKIKGNSLEYYLDMLHATREKTLASLRERDDEWLMRVDESFSWGPTNNFCKWFHVCEHESNHNGQIKWLRSRIGN
jgi:uncharacterized damage-inducible protein DinB